MKEKEYREAIVSVGRRMYAKHLVSSLDGNLSIRLAGDKILVTRRGLCKGTLKEEDMILVDLEGKLERGEVSTEVELHLEVYRSREDVKAVVHAHPPKALSLVIAGEDLSRCVLPEVIIGIGRVPITEYARPSTKEVANSIRRAIRKTDILMLDMHGSVTVGEDIWGAYYKLEKLEHWAEILLNARLLGKVRELDKKEVDSLMGLRQSYGLKGKIIRCDDEKEAKD